MKKPWYLRTVEDWDLEMVTGSKEDLIITTGHNFKKEEKDNDSQTSKGLQSKSNENNRNAD